MALPPSRVISVGETPYAHEREAIEFAIQALPNADPYYLWALLELLDPSRGSLYEIDLLILGFSALYLVEVKSGPGEYRGDFTDWWRTPPEPGARPRYMDPPLRTTNHKAKVLKSRLRREMDDPRAAPRVEPLVFLSHPDIDISGLRAGGDTSVVTRDTFARAITHHEFPGSDPDRKPRRIDRKVAKDVANALEAMGIKKRAGKAHVGAYELGSLLVEGSGFQDRMAQHRDMAHIRKRARTYLVPQQTSVERRVQLRRAAEREVRLLWDVRGHAGVLEANDYVPDAPVGPTVLFDDFDGGVPLSAFLRSEEGLSFDDRVAIIEQVGRALAHCHRKNVIHSGLSPEAVLVRRNHESGVIQTRLCNFQLGVGAAVEATSHWSALAADPWALYQAPELRDDPQARTPASDVFSLGAVAYLTFTGRAPGASLVELTARLAKEDALDPRVVANDISDEVADLIVEATRRTALHRLDNADAFVDLLLEELTAPPVTRAEEALDPLEAGKEDTVGGDLTVEGVLGHGATSRVLLVTRESDDRQYALKVAISDEHHERLAREAEVLRKLHHSRVVQLVDERTIAGRACLLLTLAGSETLQRHLQREGPVSLDLASRYGEDLLLALEHLEDEGVMHRDIKPANLAVGTASKKGYHLTLFDFSLAFVSTSELNVGTSIYRDPFLPERGRWDYNAERWGAAVTLHEMLTGVRPHYDAGVPAIDPEAKLRLAAERFDASARDRLVDFFDKALHRDAEQRFESANKMRKAWNLCFEAEALSVAPSVVAVTAVTSSDLPPADELTDEQLRALDPSTPLGALPLSTRARNALDRAGVVQAKDLLAIADNRLSAMRGVGSKVGKEILEFRRRWVAAREVETPDVTPFFPEYRGADLMVALAGLEPVMADALSDAGLHTLGAVAAAPSDQIRAVAKRARFKVAALQEALAEEQSKQDDEDIPLSLERWLEILLPRRHKQNKYLYALFGLDDPFLGRLDVRNRDVADHFGVTSAAVSIALGNARTRWRKRANVRDLVDATRAVLEAAEGAAPIGKMAEELMSRWPHGRPGRTPLHLARAAAIVRIACELQRETPNGMRIVRLHEDVPWVLGQDGLIEVVRQLGREADKLAARDILASPGEVRRVLSARVDGTRLDRLSHEQLTDLASAASKTAARSPRLELYPRGMPATRALELSAAVLTGRLEPVHVIFRVASRYPAAERLPDRPELDQLLLPHGFSFASQTGYYERAGERADQNTHLATSTSYSPASVPGAQLAPDAKTVARRDFDDRIKSALERRSLRVLGVTADRAEEAALALRDHFDLELVDLDRRMLGAIREEMKALNIPDERVLHDADREGPAGKAWNNLRTVVSRAADSLAASLLPATKPLLLVQPGLLARYQLEAFVAALVDASKDDACAAIFLLVPAHDTGGIPKINGEMVVRGILPSQGMWVPRAWLRAAGERVA